MTVIEGRSAYILLIFSRLERRYRYCGSDNRCEKEYSVVLAGKIAAKVFPNQI